MHTEKREDPLVELGYEVRDLNTVAIRNATIGFFIFTVASAVIGAVCYRVMNPTVFEDKKPTNRVVPSAPYPMVQSNVAAKTDIMDIRQHETSILTAPIGWADAEKTHLHLPIDKAIAIIAERGAKPTGTSVAAVSKGHTPDAAIGERPSAPSAKSPPAAGTMTGGLTPTGFGGPKPQVPALTAPAATPAVKTSVATAPAATTRPARKLPGAIGFGPKGN